MTRAPSGSPARMVAVVVAALVASIAGVAGAAVELDDGVLRKPQPGYAVEASAAGPVTADLLRPLTAVFADEERGPATGRPNHAEAFLDASFPSLSHASIAPAIDVRLEGLSLTTRGLFDTETDRVADAEMLRHAVRLASTDPGSDAAGVMKASLELRREEFIEEYDPWEPFNEAMFTFNRKLDQFVVKPVAKAWDKILPDRVQRSLKDAVDNLGMPRRFVNKLFQLRLEAAGLELARFLVNSTFGIGGLFDVAKPLGIEKKDADTGQTFGVYGVGPGPYLNLPFLPPLTVRDGIGLAIDGALDPFNYVIFPTAALLAIPAADRINDRAFNLELFETVEETVLDLYSAVRNAYLQRRDRVIRDAVKEQLFRQP
ncbi:MAG: VacJ family lipoprotein [Candidatus Rokubacteria bacterium]|nr:VacJ family lipoprotein [Candidatus Rokubacteria bacterium]